ncbi:hypothetical protein B7C62_24100 [Kitasatospora albolonga]|uniref:2-oxoglutarate reductase n=1 Tax=Kitasatospora albolonga TaxID=68173 RepID=A0ABC8BYR1_9ACTN|nr:hypothetical protein B7C62_24100 [Kitasatospora albolonga]
MTQYVALIADALSPGARAVLTRDGAVEVRQVDGTDRTALLAALADADAVLVRSATRIDAEALASAPRLRAVARAGVGLDNVDVAAATAAGVLVANAPASNVVSAAEHAVALLLALARHVPQAHAALKEGRWERGAYSGVELAGKTLGVLGLGRIGSLVARRLAAFDMEVIAYDPYASQAHARTLGVRLTDVDELLSRSQFLTVHLPLTEQTRGLIGFDALQRVRPDLRLVNAARGGIVDEAALYAALKEGRVAGAALDVYAHEPCTDSPLFGLDNVIGTPHLGASTPEAQDRAGTQAAESVLLALAGLPVPDAVNAPQGVPVPTV